MGVPRPGEAHAIYGQASMSPATAAGGPQQSLMPMQNASLSRSAYPVSGYAALETFPIAALKPEPHQPPPQQMQPQPQHFELPTALPLLGEGAGVSPFVTSTPLSGSLDAAGFAVRPLAMQVLRLTFPRHLRLVTHASAFRMCGT